MAAPFLARTWRLGLFVGIAAVLAFVAIRTRWSGGGAVLPPETQREVVPAASLYCEFYNFMRNATVVSFDFAVRAGEKRGDLAFAQMTLVEHDDTKTDFAAAPPPWRFDQDDDTPTIIAPDGETRIVLYGLRPRAAGVFWIEAGIRSNTYRNLEGKCRQAHLDHLR